MPYLKMLLREANIIKICYISLDMVKSFILQVNKAFHGVWTPYLVNIDASHSNIF